MKILYLAWQDRHSRRWFPVGRLVQCDTKQGGYEFSYIRGARQAKELTGFVGLPGFPKLDKQYWAPGLFPAFRYRVMNLARPDRPDYLRQLGIDVDFWDEFIELSMSGGHCHSDHFEMFPGIEPDAEGWFRTRSILHGLRHTNQHGIEAAGRLKDGDALRLAFELNNPATKHALLVYANDYYPLGWLPRYLVDCMHQGNRLLVTDVSLHVERVNLSVPLSHSLLVSFRGRLPHGFNPMRDLQHYQPIVTSGAVVPIAPAVQVEQRRY